MAYTKAHQTALDTDHAWQVELEKSFGKRAGDVRYTKEGQGRPGTGLRLAYESRRMAQEIWHKEKTLLKPRFYACEICGHSHPWAWDGDCRDDTNRFTDDYERTRSGGSGLT